ncbi:hypothetical protein GGR04_001067 [Aureimonas pseudogalii]|uniref:Uncharacterized protein n=1 Tax=Aureimonas pseudogalii TaxID=1744844 RepID=A0A7W6H2P1_9HYPH|nr:hypothetical protein [Aureimonas pseudogalii]
MTRSDLPSLAVTITFLALVAALANLAHSLGPF